MTELRRGDVAWMEMKPAHGHEQGGHRPHLVLTDEQFHELRRMAIVVPLTTAQRRWPTRVPVDENSYAICEQPRSVSLERITKVETKGYDVSEARRIINYLIGGPIG